MNLLPDRVTAELRRYETDTERKEEFVRLHYDSAVCYYMRAILNTPDDVWGLIGEYAVDTQHKPRKEADAIIDAVALKIGRAIALGDEAELGHILLPIAAAALIEEAKDRVALYGIPGGQDET